jgi:hypothetical protein
MSNWQPKKCICFEKHRQKYLPVFLGFDVVGFPVLAGRLVVVVSLTVVETLIVGKRTLTGTVKKREVTIRDC